MDDEPSTADHRQSDSTAPTSIRAPQVRADAVEQENVQRLRHLRALETLVAEAAQRDDVARTLESRLYYQNGSRPDVQHQLDMDLIAERRRHVPTPQPPGASGPGTSTTNPPGPGRGL